MNRRGFLKRLSIGVGAVAVPACISAISTGPKGVVESELELLTDGSNADWLHQHTIGPGAHGLKSYEERARVLRMAQESSPVPIVPSRYYTGRTEWIDDHGDKNIAWVERGVVLSWTVTWGGGV